MEHDPNKTITVQNVAATTTNKTVSDFFSFCGAITSIERKSINDETAEFVIEFHSEAAAKTSLLLTNALINERAIIVHPYSGPGQIKEDPVVSLKEEKFDAVPPSEIHNKNFNNIPDEERTKTSVLASILASGYILGDNAVGKAKQIDDDSKFSSSVSSGAQSISNKLKEFDERYKITRNVSEFGDKVSNTIDEFDNKYGVSQKTRDALNSVNNSFNAVIEKPEVSATLASIGNTWANLTQKVTETISPLAAKAKAEIDETMRQTNQEIRHRQGTEDTSVQDLNAFADKADSDHPTATTKVPSSTSSPTGSNPSSPRGANNAAQDHVDGKFSHQGVDIVGDDDISKTESKREASFDDRDPYHHMTTGTSPPTFASPLNAAHSNTQPAKKDLLSFDPETGSFVLS